MNEKNIKNVENNLYQEYDEKGNCIHSIDENGHEVWYEYDDDGIEISRRSSNDYELWEELDNIELDDDFF